MCSLCCVHSRHHRPWLEPRRPRNDGIRALVRLRTRPHGQRSCSSPCWWGALRQLEGLALCTRAPPPSAGASAPGAAAAVAIRACGGSAGTGAASTAPAPSPANRLAQPQWPQPGHGAQASVGRHTFHPAEPFLPVPGSALRQAPSRSTPVIDGVVERPGLPAAASTSFFPLVRTCSNARAASPTA